MVYSKGKEGYLSKRSIDSLRSCFGNDIFQQEQYHLFQLQTGLREEIKEKTEQHIRNLIAQTEAEDTPNLQLQFLFVKLRKQLAQHKGKKVYGYLPKPIKATVNEIVAQLSTEPIIDELYKEWNKVNQEKLSLYYESKDPAVPLVDNKEFRSIKNMIIRAVMEMPQEVKIATSEAHVAVSKEIISALAKLIGDKCMAHQQTLQGQIDHRLQTKINEKKLALGLKTEVTQAVSYQTEEEYEQSM